MPELSCEACGRRFVFKPEYAGKTLKCKCGQPIKAPAQVPAAAAAAAAPAPAARAAAGAPDRPARQSAAASTAPAKAATAAVDGGDDFSKLFAEAEAEYEMAPEPTPAPTKKPPIARPAAAAAAGNAAAAGPTSPMLGYARAAVKAPVDDATKASIVTDLYVPIAMIITGLVLYLYYASLHPGTGAAQAAAFVLVSVGLNIALVFVALLIGVKVINLGLGPLHTALLKIAAVAILPVAVTNLIQWYTGLGFFGYGITLILYYILLFYLFDMDGGEINIVTGIMWAIQFVLGFFIMGALMTGVGMSSGKRPGPSVASSLLSGPSDADMIPDDATMSGTEIDKASQDAIDSKKAFEAHEWLSVNSPNHNGLGVPQSRLRKLADDFVIDGCKSVYCSAIDHEGSDQLCTRLIVEMPTDPAKRSAILWTRDQFEGREERSKDTGGKYITVLINETKVRKK